MRILFVMVAGYGLLSGTASGQVARMRADATPSFEVATIKRADSNTQNQGFQTRGHRIAIVNESVTSMMMFAYSIHEKQIVDGPAWLSERYDVNGVPDVEGQPSMMQYQGMLRKLLEERFGLKVRREQRELPIYAITVAKGGAKIAKTTLGPDALPDQTGNSNGREPYMKFTNNTMDEFALGMQYFLPRPVVNQTGLAGRYDFTLKWSTEEAPVTDAAASPGMFTAIQEQLGLKLEATKGPAEVVVVGHVERPSEN